jgi:hypothetical protein
LKDSEYDQLQDVLDALFPAHVRSDGMRKAMEIPAFRKEGRITRRAALEIVRNHLNLRLHGICRDCETESPEFYMVRQELWQEALAGTYPTGLLCLRCLVKRLAPRQLFAEDLSNGTDKVGSLPSSNEWEWTDPASGAPFRMEYQIRFPSREGPPALHCTMDFFSDGADPPEVFLDACDDRRPGSGIIAASITSISSSTTISCCGWARRSRMNRH